MTLSFSQRVGAVEVLDTPIKGDAPRSIRVGLWNVLYIFLWDRYADDYVSTSSLERVLKRIWIYYFNEPLDEMENHYFSLINAFKQHFFSCEWHECFSFVEFICQEDKYYIKPELVKNLNNRLEKEFSAYRIVEGRFTEIQSSEEVNEICAAIKGTPYSTVKDHLVQALKHLSDRTNPDFRNSIKESISAVEALCSKIVNDDKASLGKALKVIEERHTLHPALKDAFSKLYGYTSDSDGIRHRLMEESTLSQSDARFMLIACSAFVNYLIDLKRD